MGARMPDCSITSRVLMGALVVPVSILDLAGRLVARPWQGEMPAGTGRVAWRGATDGGRAVPSGQYRPDATTGAKSASRRSDGVTTGACAPISRA